VPKTYDRVGLRFQYPDNWTLDETEALSGEPSISVYSPGGAFFSVALHPRNAHPRKLADAALTAMQEEYEDLESEPVEEVVAGLEAVGHDINFCYLDLTNTATVRCMRRGPHVLVVFCQAEDRDYVELKAVFAAMTHSLLTSTPQSSEA
jgi:hypothetical protein